jgi:hypothetical protein
VRTWWLASFLSFARRRVMGWVSLVDGYCGLCAKVVTLLLVSSFVLTVATPVQMGRPTRDENSAASFSFVVLNPLIESRSYGCSLCWLANLHEMTGRTEDLDELLATWRRVLREGVTGPADARMEPFVGF